MPKWLSDGRFDSYLRAAGGDADAASHLYEWGAALSAAALEAVQYVEVVLRNAIDDALRGHRREAVAGIPWFLMPICVDRATQDRIDHDIAVVRARLRKVDQRREVRGQIVAGLSMGFWVHLLGAKHENLWRKSLRYAFPHSSGRRSDVSAVLAALNNFRNKLAHHDSLLSTDVPFRLVQSVQILGWIDPQAAAWLQRNERVTAVMAERPVGRKDTVVVAARDAWPLYQSTGAYVCQAGRSFKAVDYLAFYSQLEIKREVPRILEHMDNVDWSIASEHQFRSTGQARDQRIANVMATSRNAGWTAGRYQLFLLTQPGEEGHLTLPKPMPHESSGRGSAFTQSQRYVVREALRRAQCTSGL